ncbi:hypothetical protein HDU84_009136 [Entophlyctis sp. JEL0112]|nr:hypothetical protein HDU84_009136 [Entophlyctis sp. JEL0112]
MNARDSSTVTESYTYSLNGNKTYRVEFVRDVTDGTLTVTMQTTAEGWVAIGVGAGKTGLTMFNATMWIGWANGTSVLPVISQRHAVTDALPLYSSVQDGAVVEFSTNSSLPGAQLGVSFVIPDSYISSSGTTGLLLAYSSKLPTTPSDPSSFFQVHDSMQGFLLDLSATTTESASLGTFCVVEMLKLKICKDNLYCSDSANSYCFQASVSGDEASVTITLQTITDGWAAVGVGCKTMTCDRIYVAWKGSNGSSIVSQRTAASQVSPSISSASDFSLLASTPKNMTVYSTSSLLVSFTIPSTGISMTGTTNFIYAYFSSAPSTPDDPSSAITQHGNGYGSFGVNFATKTTVTLSSSTNLYQLTHGIIMIVAWVLIPFASIFIARFLKNRLGHRWYLSHMGLGITTLVLTAAGLAVIESGLSTPLSERFVSSPHAVLGTTLAFVLLPFQVALGFVANTLFVEMRTRIPWWDQAHWWLGRLAVAVGCAASFLGIGLYGGSAVAEGLLAVVVVFGIAAQGVGQYVFGATRHVYAVMDDEGTNKRGRTRGTPATEAVAMNVRQESVPHREVSNRRPRADSIKTDERNQTKTRRL